MSIGTFQCLRRFYIRGAKMSGMKMCCCKLHLHKRWAVAAIIKLCEKGGNIMPESITTYESSFVRRCYDCPSDATTYISWDWTPNKNKVWKHITNKWEEFKCLLDTLDPSLTILFHHFEKVEHSSKSVTSVKTMTTEANKDFCSSF